MVSAVLPLVSPSRQYADGLSPSTTRAYSPMSGVPLPVVVAVTGGEVTELPAASVATTR